MIYIYVYRILNVVTRKTHRNRQTDGGRTSQRRRSWDPYRQSNFITNYPDCPGDKSSLREEERTGGRAGEWMRSGASDSMTSGSSANRQMGLQGYNCALPETL